MTIAVDAPSPHRNPQAAGLRPWGAGRLTPYPVTARRPHATVTVDPVTQLGVFRDRAGQVVEMGRHGTSSGTETSTTTNSDSAPDQGHDQDSRQD
ncbi:putative ATP-grasp-modified RiPP [Streptomyces pinistramenti]|uniref:putative ATP-grasp-modified RiPP n=1 Tax=Streptomyces pinistramenti TaxID=2884812 RepID=UPI001D0849CB|nr:putative ATP-grasp-modified RiPP [Streptomyces pinistramenti]MCB5909837.1 putative ATP-grasp-modified RiPP [Streptomyces pinistramenti]